MSEKTKAEPKAELLAGGVSAEAAKSQRKDEAARAESNFVRRIRDLRVGRTAAGKPKAK